MASAVPLLRSTCCGARGVLVSHLLDRLRTGDMVVFHPAFGFDFVGMEGSQVTRLVRLRPAGSLALACCVLGVVS